MNKIIIGFYKPKAFFEPFSWLIRIVTNCAFSHAYIKYYDDYSERWIIFQASGLKVNFIGQEIFDVNEEVYEEFKVPVSNNIKKKIIQHAVDVCGSSYGIEQILGFSWVMFMRLFGKKVQNPFYNVNTFFCSELAADELEEIGFTGLDPQVTTPKDLYNWMVNNDFKQLEEK